MGLDMYLSRKHYMNMNQAKQVADVLSVEDPTGISYISERVMYWRKANQIHKWFVENVQDGQDDCGEYYVPIESLRALRDLCERVIADPDLAPELLSTYSGFFFGGTEYDEYYMEDVEDTLAVLDKILADAGTHDYYYSSSW